MDPLLLAMSFMRRRRFEDCAQLCSELLEKNPRDQAVWVLKMRALTEQTYVDEVEVDEEGIAEMTMDENSSTNIPRPGTSFKNPMTAVKGKRSEMPAAAVRPISQSGRPLSGFVRPGTQSARPSTMEQAIGTARSVTTARPVTTSSGRYVRLGTASMISEADGPFVDPSRLDLMKYSKKPALAKTLFEYLFHHENDIRSALQLASHATEAAGFTDWWWKLQLGKCYFRIGMIRDAERQFKSSLKHQDMIDTYLHLGKVYVRLDHPLTAIEWYQKGLRKFPGEVTLLIAIARIHEALKDTSSMTTVYREVLHQDNINIEASACLATNFFYNDQPEVALQYYRRLLLMGVNNADVYNNMALCCFYSHNFDSAFACFDRALGMASDEEMANIWYNIGCVYTSMSELELATYCYKLALAASSDHAEAYNNLGVLYVRRRKVALAKQMFATSSELNPMLYESHYNGACLQESIGEYANCFMSVRKALAAFPDHYGSKKLLGLLREHFCSQDLTGVQRV